LSKAEALRRARLELRSDPRYAHPYYWAPFVLLGRGEDGVELAAPAVRPGVVTAAVALLLVFVAVPLWWRYRRRASSRG
ncbi:MAG: CHAT domain-containing protein, partial [Thermoanaerobaculia bacterium]|nr:CHAT domain-containing protein [Thermoanaerobaculia bacterium]